MFVQYVSPVSENYCYCTATLCSALHTLSTFNLRAKWKAMLGSDGSYNHIILILGEEGGVPTKMLLQLVLSELLLQLVTYMEFKIQTQVPCDWMLWIAVAIQVIFGGSLDLCNLYLFSYTELK